MSRDVERGVVGAQLRERGMNGAWSAGFHLLERDHLPTSDLAGGHVQECRTF